MKKLLILYSAVFIIFCLFTFLFVDQNFFYLNNLYTGFATNLRTAASIVYFIFISVFFLFYFFILRKQVTPKAKYFLLVPIIGTLAYPAILSFDLFNYIATAKVSFHFFENPYLIMPIEFQGEPILMFTRATNKIALYGPLWVGMTSIPYYLSFGNYIVSIILFKLFISVFYFGILYLIWKLTKSYESLIFFAASPLVLIETFISGHNDVVMMFFALLSVYFLKNKKILLALLVLLLSIMIKYATIFLIPLFIYYFYLKLRNKKNEWNNFYLIGFILMLIVFFLSPLREEIYPWYAIWPLTFLSLLWDKMKNISLIFVFFTFCLMLRYIPFMLTGNYFGITPYIKLFITFLLPGVVIIIIFLKKFLITGKK